MKVPTRLVVYPNEGHIFVKPADFHDYNLRSLEWFDEWFTKSVSGLIGAHPFRVASR
jgi:dipeptidyl aminopeptidase/acylaminoacyl peptidase